MLDGQQSCRMTGDAANMKQFSCQTCESFTLAATNVSRLIEKSLCQRLRLGYMAAASLPGSSSLGAAAELSVLSYWAAPCTAFQTVMRQACRSQASANPFRFSSYAASSSCVCLCTIGLLLKCVCNGLPVAENGYCAVCLACHMHTLGLAQLSCCAASCCVILDGGLSCSADAT